MAKEKRIQVRLILMIFGLFFVLNPAYPDSFFYDGVNYSFELNNVEDLDQIRGAYLSDGIVGLPNDGNMYCVPTAAVNWMAYIANHGYPNMDPGSGFWEVSPPQYLTEYNHITGNLFLMGFLMGTNPDTGTGSSKNAVQFWLDAAYPGQFMVVEVFASQGWSPQVRDAAMLVLSDGLVNIVMGWYTNPDTNMIHIRQGGHVVTLVSAANTSKWAGNVKLNDPAESDSMWAQDNFSSDSSNFTAINATYCRQDENGNPKNCTSRTQDRLHYTNSGYMDGYIAIIPKFGLSYSLDFSEVILQTPIKVTQDKPPVKKIATENKVLDIAIDPTSIQQLYIMEDSNVVWNLDILTGQSKRFARVKKPMKLIYDGKLESLYVLGPKKIFSLNRKGKKQQKMKLPDQIDEIAFDQRNNRLVGLSRRAGKIFLFDQQLTSFVELIPPPGLLGEAGNLSLSIHPLTGELFTVYEGARYFTKWDVTDTGEIRTVEVTIPAEILNLQGVFADELGKLFLTGDNKIFPVDVNGQLDRLSPFFELESGPELKMSMPFTNFDPNEMIGPSFYNVLPIDAL